MNLLGVNNSCNCSIKAGGESHTLANKSVSFKSRAVEIRQADKIMRKMSNQFDTMAISRFENYSVVKKKSLPKSITSWIGEKWAQLFSERDRIALMDSNDETENVINGIKKTKIANCGEMAIIARAAFLANGYKDVKIVALEKNANLFSGKKLLAERIDEIDHAFVVVNLGKKAKMNDVKTYDKKAFIVDPWMGFVDYVKPAFNKYESLYMSGEKKFKIKNEDNMKNIPDCLNYSFFKAQSDNKKNLNVKQNFYLVDEGSNSVSITTSIINDFKRKYKNFIVK